MKRILTVLVLTCFLIFSITTADDSDVGAVESITSIDSAESVIVDSDYTIINANTVISMDGLKTIKGTVLRSINQRNVNIPFKPDNAIAVTIANVLKGDKYNFGTVALSDFSTDGVSSDKEYDGIQKLGNIPLTKEEYLLGGDILIKSDSYNFSSDTYSFTTITEDNIITLQEAIMMIYKSIGQSQYKHSFQFSPRGTYPVPIGETSFVELVPDVFAAVDNTRYYTDVFSTRSIAEAYWRAATTDKLLIRNQDRDDIITLADFCYYLFTKMDREKEPVLTEEEMEMLLVAHGRELPIYLDSNQLGAVKHLIARGITESDLDYASPLKIEDALRLLMRAKFPETRLTFKNVQYPYISELVKKGYIPMDMKLEKPMLMDVQIMPINAATISDLDYYIEVSPNTLFHSAMEPSRVLTDLYVSSIYGDISDYAFPGTFVKLVDNGRYYHVRVPISIIDDTKAYNSSLECFTLNSAVASDVPENLSIPYGGGVYKWENGRLIRSPFTSEFSPDLIDLDRKLNAMNSAKSTKLGVMDRKVEFKFKLVNDKDLDSILWDGKPLKTAPQDVFSGLKDDKGNYTIMVTADDPYKYLLRHLTYKSDISSSELVRAYVADDRSALVSLKWLKRAGLVTDITEIEAGKKWVIYNDKENTLIDLVNGVVVSGQVVTEISKDDESPYIVKDPLTGDMLVDYRAVNNMTSTYLLIRDDNGNVSMSTPLNSTYYYGYSYYQSIYPLLGEGYQSAKNLRGDNSLLSLENTFPTANWVIYKKRNGVVNSEYLLVFRPAVKEKAWSPIDLQNFSIDNFGLKEVKNVRINAYEIDMATITDKDATLRTKNFILSNPASKGPGIYYDSMTSQYYYKVPIVTSLKDAYNKYMSVTPSLPMPIVSYKNMLVNLNLNLYSKSETDLARYPKILKNSIIPTDDLKYSGEVEPNDFILAIAGAQSKYYPYPRKSWIELYGAGTVYFGSILAKLDVSEDDRYDKVYKFMVGSTVLATYPYAIANSNSPFTEVFRGGNKSVYVYGLDDQFRLVAFDQLVEDEQTGWLPTFLKGGYRDIFDWNAYSLSQWVNIFDDGLTIANLFVMSLIPRLMLFIFISFMVLSLAVENRLLIWVAENIVDPFKVLSCGLTSIEHVRTKNAWLSVFIATVMIAMMSSGILELIAWVVKFAMTLLKM